MRGEVGGGLVLGRDANVLEIRMFFMHIEAEVAHTVRFPGSSIPMPLKPTVFLPF